MGRADNHSGTILKYSTKSGKLRYQCRIALTQSNGLKKYINASASTQEEARKKALKKLNQFKRTGGIPSGSVKEKANETIEKSILEFFDGYSMHWASSTKIVRRANVKNMIVASVGKFPVKNINVDFLERLIAEMLQNYSRRNVGMMYSFLGDYCFYLAKRGIIEENYFLDVSKLPKRTKSKEYASSEEFEDDDAYMIFDENEIKLIHSLAIGAYMKLNKKMEIVEKKEMQYRACLFYVLFLTGMRSGELRALTIDDVDFVNHQIRINKALSIAENTDGKISTIVKTPKTKNSKRRIGINRQTEEIIKLLISLRPSSKTKNICCNSTGGWIERRTFIKYFDGVLKWLNIPKNGRSPHNLRHSFISFGIEKNPISPLADKEMIFVSRYVGHRDLSTTLNVYSHLCENKLADVKYKTDDDGFTVLEIDFNTLM